MSYHRIFFTNVVAIAAAKGMSHQELASKANLSAGALSSITRGQGNPTLETMASIASALEIPLTYLLDHHDLGADYYILSNEEKSKQSLPGNYECITVILPKYRAYLVKKWSDEAIKEMQIKK